MMLKFSKILHDTVCFAIFAVVIAPIFLWIYVQATTPHPQSGPCAVGDTDCRIDDLDMHTTP